jgi:peroxiredoxin
MFKTTMKYLFLLLFLPASLFAFQKSNAKPAPKDPRENATITLACRLYGMSSNMDSITLFEPMGLATRPIARGGKRASDSLFIFTIPASSPRFYAIGQNEINTATVILGEESNVNFFANAQIIQKGRTAGSAINKAYENVLKRIELFRSQAEKARQTRISGKGAEQQDAIKQLTALNVAKTKYLDSLKVNNQLLWRVATLFLHPEFTGQKGFADEKDFLSKQFFANANLATDRNYDNIPDVTTAFEAWHTALVAVAATPEEIKPIMEAALAKILGGTKTHRMALSGMVNAAKNSNSGNYPSWARMYIEQYKSQSYGEINRLDFELKKASTFTPGFEAPDIAGMTPDSSTFALSKLRGKVVLIDFWASWCGPCRKENPNVKVNYNKYKDKGFEILGVSLDRDRTAWKNAIEQDGLTWHHVSDLKGWQSEHAAMYSVTSIPQTVLIDKKGNILARNIRGEQLGAKLKEIFGE